MAARFAARDTVQTPFGKGVVLEVRNNGALLVQIQRRSLVVAASAVSALAGPPPKTSGWLPPAAPGQVSRHAATEVDLHGLRVEEALSRIDDALDAALLAGLAELRFIHGRSGGRLRGALHARLRAISSVRGLHLDPRNPGVTIVKL